MHLKRVLALQDMVRCWLRNPTSSLTCPEPYLKALLFGGEKTGVACGESLRPFKTMRYDRCSEEGPKSLIIEKNGVQLDSRIPAYKRDCRKATSCKGRVAVQLAAKQLTGVYPKNKAGKRALHGLSMIQYAMYHTTGVACRSMKVYVGYCSTPSQKVVRALLSGEQYNTEVV